MQRLWQGKHSRIDVPTLVAIAVTLGAAGIWWAFLGWNARSAPRVARVTLSAHAPSKARGAAVPGTYSQGREGRSGDPYEEGYRTAGAGAGAPIGPGANRNPNATPEGAPTVAFDWNTFEPYSTYVAYHNADAAGRRDRVYVYGAGGQAPGAAYYWEAPPGSSIVGAPRWSNTGSIRYVYVALNTGSVYRLLDDTAARTLTIDSATQGTAARNPFSCSCTIVSPLGIEGEKLSWRGITNRSIPKRWLLDRKTWLQPQGSPFATTSTTASQ
jgi:hypothetical protein